MKRMRMRFALVFVCAFLAFALGLAICPPPLMAADFTPIPFLTGATTSKAYGISPDGHTVVGDGGFFPFRWYPGTTNQLAGLGAIAYDVTSSGYVVGGPNVRLWTDADIAANTFQDVGTLDKIGGAAYGISANGGVIVGLGFSAGPGGTYYLGDPTGVYGKCGVVNGCQQALRAVNTGGVWSVQGLKDLPGNSSVSQTAWSQANAVSADGQVVVGTGWNNDVEMEAFVHKMTVPDSGILAGDGLGYFPGGYNSGAEGISADGSTVVGWSSSSSGTNAFRAVETTPGNWTMSNLGALWTSAGGWSGSRAYDASYDGSVIVGKSRISFSEDRASIWTASSGMVNLQDVLTAQGAAPPAGWTLTEARAVSDNGLYIAGFGSNPSSQTQAWRVQLDNLALSLVTASTASVSQTVNTPGSAFNLEFDYKFLTTTGDLDVILNGISLGIIPAPSPLQSDFLGASFLVDGTLLNQIGVPLVFELTGPTSSQVLIDNILFPGLENGDFLLSLNSWTPSGNAGVVPLSSEPGGEPIPEPATLLLLGTGLAGLGLFMRRKKA